MLESHASPSLPKIFRLSELSAAETNGPLARIREIFFESSSRQAFKDAADKENFFDRWTRDYFNLWSDWIYLASTEGDVAGYLMGCPDSHGARSTLGKNISSYEVFADLFSEFPAHLHVNVAAKFRGQRIGEQLLGRFTKDLRAHSIPGVHIVTSPDARNRRFYERCGFSHVQTRQWREQSLLFMGQKLNANGSSLV